MVTERHFCFRFLNYFLLFSCLSSVGLEAEGVVGSVAGAVVGVGLEDSVVPSGSVEGLEGSVVAAGSVAWVASVDLVASWVASVVSVGSFSAGAVVSGTVVSGSGSAEVR